jgi:putative DNA primase/helicase
MIIPNKEQRATFENYRTKNGELILGEFEGCWEYLNADGSFHCLNVRYASLIEEASKEFRPFILKKDTLKCEYPYKTRPIYNLKELLKNPSKLVLIVEGEKTADKAQELFPEYVVISWMGGAKVANKMDLTHLKNRNVCLWPDNDLAGFEAMADIKEQLQWLTGTIGLIDPTSLNVEPKWDLADFNTESDSSELSLLKKMINDSFKENKEFLISSYPDLNKGTNKKPLDTANNYRHLIKNFNITVRWNMMKRVRDVQVPGRTFYNEEQENAALEYVKDLAVVNGLSIYRADKHLDAIGWDNLYHPVRDWILKNPLENKGLLQEFCQLVKTTNDELSHLLIKRWMISAIAALFNEGDFCAQGVLVIQGEGHTHKSTFIMELVPEPLKAVKGGTSLDPSKKDDILTLSEYWIVELGELDATFRKSDIAKLKSHITNEIDDVRRPHAIRNSKMIRRTVYAATVNEDKFLVDSTGNRRWWTISVTEPIKTRSGINMQQVWREAYDLWLNGESPVLLEHELKLLNNSNESFEFIEPLEEKLDNFFDWEESFLNQTFMNCTEILEHFGFSKPTRNDCNKLASLLKKRKITKGVGSTAQKRKYYMPRKLYPDYLKK